MSFTTTLKPLVSAIKIIDDSGFVYDTDALMAVNQSVTSNANLNDPKDVLYIGRQGTFNEAYGAMATFQLSRYENVGTGSRTRVDLDLKHDSFTSTAPTMTWLSGGNVGIGTTSPSAPLEVARSTGEISRFASTGTNQISTVGFYKNTTAKVGDIKVNGSSDNSFQVDAVNTLKLSGSSIQSLNPFNMTGNTLSGDTVTGGDLTLESTSHATKGKIFIGSTSLYNEVNDRLGIGELVPDSPIHITVPTGEARLKLECAGTGALDQASVRFQAGGKSWIPFVSGDQDKLKFYSNTLASSVMTLDVTGNVGIGTTTPAASSLLDLTSSVKGFLPPRMTTVQRDAIASPADGLTVFDTTSNNLSVYSTTEVAWKYLAPSNVPKVTRFTSSGTYSPTSGVRYAEVEMCAAGGGAQGTVAVLDADNAACAAGGGSGGYHRFYLSVAPTSDITVTVGSGVSGGNGGNTVFGTHLTCTGGVVGGRYNTGTTANGSGNATGGAGGSAGGVSGGTSVLAISGTAGGNGRASSNSTTSLEYADGGDGGNCILGNSGIGSKINPANGNALMNSVSPTGYGAGAAGGASLQNSSASAKSGAAGIVIVTEYF